MQSVTAFFRFVPLSTGRRAMRGLTSRGLDRFHPLLGSQPERAIPVTDWIRAHERVPMSLSEMHRRASAVWRTIDGETDAPSRETRAKASRLYSVGVDLQQAHALRARLMTAWGVIRFLTAVVHRSWGLGVAR